MARFGWRSGWYISQPGALMDAAAGRQRTGCPVKDRLRHFLPLIG